MRLAPLFLRPADVRPEATDGPPPTREPVLLVHGTFANVAKGGAPDWWRPGSDYARQLDEQLQNAGSPARCWAHLPGVGAGGRGSATPYAWTGANSEHDRREAGRALAQEIAALEADSRVARYHLVAHSHGGNVVLNALRELPRAPAKLGVVVYMGTPFLRFRHGQAMDIRWLSIPMYGAALAVGAAVDWPVDELPRLLWALAMVALLVAVLAEALLTRRKAPPRADDLYGSGRARAFVFDVDEAINGLRLAQATAEDPQRFIQQFASNAPPQAPAVPVTSPPADDWFHRLKASGIKTVLDLLEAPAPAPAYPGLLGLQKHTPPTPPSHAAPGPGGVSTKLAGLARAAGNPSSQTLHAVAQPLLQFNVGGITLAQFLKFALWVCLLAPRLAQALVSGVVGLLSGAVAKALRRLLLRVAQRVSSWALPRLVRQGAFGADEGRFEGMSDLPPGVWRHQPLSEAVKAEAAAVAAGLGGLAGRAVQEAMSKPDAYSIKAYVDRALRDGRLAHSHYYQSPEIIRETAALLAASPAQIRSRSWPGGH